MDGRKRKGYTPQHKSRLKKICLEEFYEKCNEQATDKSFTVRNDINNHCETNQDKNHTGCNSPLLKDLVQSSSENLDDDINVVNINGNVVEDIRNDILSKEDQVDTSEMDLFQDDLDVEEDGPNDKLMYDVTEKVDVNNHNIDSDTDDEDESYVKPTSNPDNSNSKESDRMAEFLEEFLLWCLTSKLSRDNLKALLAMLRKYFNAPLPKDPRTLFKTPKGTKLYEMSNGSYWHYGLKKILDKIIKKYEANNIDVSTIKLSINIDGAQIGKSSKKGLWIISISEEIFKDVYIVGAHHGEKKPKDSNELLELLVNELIETITNGYRTNSYKKKYIIRLVALICDVPAKSYVLKVKGHSGYDSCTKCEITGTKIGNVVYFTVDVNNLPPLRTDDAVKNNAYKNTYQHGESLFAKIPHFGLVTNVYIDPMHLVYLGLIRKLLMLYLYGPPKVRLKPKQIKLLSNRLEIIRHCTPIDFNRTVTDLELTKRTWKATVYRQFLYYSGPAVLKGIIKEELYDNFVTLHIAMTILVTHEYCTPSLIDYAHDLLKYFVSTFAKSFGEKYVSHNVHNCLHLADEAKRDGSLEKRSAWRFENAIRVVTSTITKPEQALQQLDRRTAEKDMYEKTYKITPEEIMQFELSHRDGPIILNEKHPSEQWKRMKLNLFKVCCDRPNDQFVLLNDSEQLKIVQCSNFVKINTIYFVIGKELKVTGNVYDTHYHSSDWNMVEIMSPEDTMSPLKMWPCENIKSKLFKMIVDDTHIVVPLRHTQ